MKIKFDYIEVGKIFPKIKNIKKYSSIPDTVGAIPFVSSSSLNNGISGYVDDISFEGNCITVSTNGKCFDSFYHEGKIAISTDVELLTHPNLNSLNAMYLCTIFNAESFKWGYGRKPKNDKVFKTRIMLPVKDNGELNWQYMEDIIKQIMLKQYAYGTINDSLQTKNNATQTLRIFNRDENIKLFPFYKLLDQKLYKAKAHAKIDLVTSDYKKDGYVPFVSRTDTNNAIDCYVKDDDSLQKEKGNCIIIGDTTSTIYYQEDDFVAGDHIVVCRSKWINKYTALYIKTLLDKERYRYSYGRAFKKDFINNTILAIPVDSRGNPDWVFMQEYIKSLPYADRI